MNLSRVARSMITMHVGIDDTDSPEGGCTTYVASLLVQKFTTFGVSFIDYPNLVRLNPNVPWKTRGNGALCLRFKCPEARIEHLREAALDLVENQSDLDQEGTEPGIVFFSGDSIPAELRTFSRATIQGVVRMRNAMKLIKSLNAEAFGFKNGRGIIGALAAIGENLTRDYTYEFIAYRAYTNRGTPRKVDAASVFDMDKKMTPLTYNNVDNEIGRVLITPHGPDPILYGIRGESAEAVEQAHTMVKSYEPVERWMIFRTNQGTDAHLRRAQSIRDVSAFSPIIIRGRISKAPWIVPRRHVIFVIADETAQVHCAAYEPTGELRRTAKELLVGDAIEAHGGVRPPSKKRPITVNLEKIRVLKLVPKVTLQNPQCPHCSRRLQSMGAGKGFRCHKCGFRSTTLAKTAFEQNRGLRKKLYVTSPHSQRHLTKPLSRYGLEKSGNPEKMTSPWFWVSD